MRSSYPSEFLAHSINSWGKGHLLVEHLRNTASLARGFAEAFGGGDLAYYAGLWHDIGKFSEEFQSYIHNPQPSRGPDHSTAGAVLAAKANLQVLAFPIAGHHGGLPDMSDLKNRLWENLRNPRWQRCEDHALRSGLPVRPTSPPSMPAFLTKGNVFTQEMFLRFLFSALVDADSLDTERHFLPEQSRTREGWPSIEQLARAFFEDQERRFGRPGGDSVGQVRHQVYLHCLQSAEEPPGLFRLIAPTGCGKTRSSLAFALRHAQIHGLRRIIVAIPYTSIVDQTAQVYREALGDSSVVEHHSAVGWKESDKDVYFTPTPEEERAQLAIENWDAPLIVTTTVQFLESLFANTRTRCRKLHNIARSVVVIDEVQMLPLGLLGPTLDALQELASNYGVTILLCSATPPDFQGDVYMHRLQGVREVIPDPAPLFEALNRVQYELNLDPAWTWERVAEEMRHTPQCMTVVNTRKDALALLSALGDPEALHLSTLLCGAHRLKVLQEVKDRKGKTCRLVATQVVEAGVDLDFPVVFRALGPLDRIVQAAGRCNREGRLPFGRMVVFNPEEGSLPNQAEYATATEITRNLLGQGVDPQNPRVHQDYFRKLAKLVNQDKHSIQPLRRQRNYPEVAEKFRLIEDDGVPVIVPYPSRERQAELVHALRQKDADLRLLARRLQPYLVNLRRQQLEELCQKGLVQEVRAGFWEWLGWYDPVTGIGPGLADPERFLV